MSNLWLNEEKDSDVSVVMYIKNVYIENSHKAENPTSNRGKNNLMAI